MSHHRQHHTNSNDNAADAAAARQHHSVDNGGGEVSWNPAQVCVDFQVASAILGDRGLKLAAKWIAELWMGLPPEIIDNTTTTTSLHNDTTTSSSMCSIPERLHVRQETNPAVAYAKSLLDLGEYAHAAAILSETSLNNPGASVETMNPPLADLSSKAVFYRAYALYLAGEKRKRERIQQQEKYVLNYNGNFIVASSCSSFSHSSLLTPPSFHLYKKPCIALFFGSQGSKSITAENPYLFQLATELFYFYERHELDAFGLYIYGTVLSRLENNPSGSPPAHLILMESILQFPYNWSAWLDLAALAVDQPAVEVAIEATLQPALASHCMYHFFCGHLLTERQQHQDALVLYERWMDPACFGGSPYLLTQYATASYHNRNFAEAASIFKDLHHHMPYRLDMLDEYSNILYVQEDAVALSQLAHVAATVDPRRPESCIIAGNYYSLKQMRAKAVECFRQAVELDPSFTSAWTLLGHEYVEWKQTAHAMEAYRKAAAASANDYRAWYGLGQTYEFLHMYLFAAYYYRKAVSLRPYDPRMWTALGNALLEMGNSTAGGTTGGSNNNANNTTAPTNHHDAAVLAFERALEYDTSDAIATQKLASLYRTAGQTELAATASMRYLEIRHQAAVSNNPNNSSSNNNKAPHEKMRLEKMLQEIPLEDTEADALLFLAMYFKEHDSHDLASM
jgi:anaphase-promoting complex subunit 8